VTSLVTSYYLPLFTRLARLLFLIVAGHLDLTVLGGLQVSAAGDLANWMVPGKLIPGFGGAFDLVGSGSRVIVTMDHVAKDGSPKILPECSFPLTGKGVVDMIITERAVFQVDKIGGKGLTLTEVARGLTVGDIQAVTGCDFKVADNLSFMDSDDDAVLPLKLNQYMGN
jgi:3-oxoacid CoA-transferase